MTFNFSLIFVITVIISAQSVYGLTSLKAIPLSRSGQGYGIPEKPLNPPPPISRPSSPLNDADYVIEEYPSEVPVKSKPIESPDREPIFIDQKDEGKYPSQTQPVARQSFNNVRPPVPAIPSRSVDPPLGGYNDPLEIVSNRVPAKHVAGSQYPSTPPSDESILGAHHSGAAGCTCVPYFQCSDEGYMITTGAGIIDPRIAISPPPNPKSYTNDDKVKPDFCGTYHTCCKEESRQSQKDPPIARPTCGTRNPSGISPRILTPGTAKSESEFGEWPWMGAVLKVENGIHVFQCGGTLIDDRHVITVAHCVSRFAGYSQGSSYSIIVRLGEWDTQQESELIPHEDYRVISVMTHPEFMNQSLWNDMAILKLDRRVEFKENINPVCLPSPLDQFEGQLCTTTGWGKNAYQGGAYSNIMKEAHLPVIPRKECLKSLRSTRLGPRFRLHSSFICAGGEEGVDSCKGDGGGPLVCERNDGSYAVAGLVAWGIDCGQPGIPGVYVNVQQFLPFINDHTTPYSEPQNEPEGWSRTQTQTPLPPQRPQNINIGIANPRYPANEGYQRRPALAESQRQFQPPPRRYQAPPRSSYGEALQVRPPQSFPASGY